MGARHGVAAGAAITALGAGSKEVPSMMPGNRVSARTLFEAAALAVLIAAVWLFVYVRFDLALLSLAPVRGYDGDAILGLATIKAFAASDISVLLPKFNDRLNAPFVANWNDWPFEDLVYAAPALFVRFFGLHAGVNLFLLSLHIASGLSFYLVSRLLGHMRPWCIAGAVIYASSTFLFVRALPHLTVATVWHLPLVLLTVVWVLRPGQVRIAFGLMPGLCIVTSVVAGLLNPYYFLVFVFLLAFGFAGQLLAGNRRQAAWSMACISAAGTAFVIQHLDTLSFAFAEGANAQAVGRDLGGLTTWGLRLADLMFPFEHRIDRVGALSQSIYFSRTPEFLRGESQFSYVGIVPLVGLVLLFFIGTAQVAARRFDDVSDWFWVGLGISSFAVVGGLNYVAGAFGFVLLRATTRYSIFFVLIGLLFIGELLSKRRYGMIGWLVLLVVPIALYDQIWPSFGDMAHRQGVVRAATSDRDLVARLESGLPKEAMVFQLPVKGFPETGPIHTMHDYDHFVPYLYSNHLRFSYGTTKGRGDADWQQLVATLPVGQMIDALERYGFAAILVNRQAFPDGAQQLIAQLQGLPRPVLAENDRLVAVRLNPGAEPVLPAAGRQLSFGPAFSGPEGNAGENWRWAMQSAATVNVGRSSWLARRGPTESTDQVLDFWVQGLERCNVWMAVDQSEKVQVLSAGESSRHVRVPIKARTHDIPVVFSSDCVPKRPDNGDPRSLTFRLLFEAADR